MKTTLAIFSKLYAHTPEHSGLLQEGRVKGLSYYDILFNNSTVSIIWSKGLSFKHKMLNMQHDTANITEELWKGVWTYSFEYPDGTYFTIYSKTKLF